VIKQVCNGNQALNMAPPADRSYAGLIIHPLLGRATLQSSTLSLNHCHFLILRSLSWPKPALYVSYRDNNANRNNLVLYGIPCNHAIGEVTVLGNGVDDFFAVL